MPAIGCDSYESQLESQPKSRGTLHEPLRPETVASDSRQPPVEAGLNMY